MPVLITWSTNFGVRSVVSGRNFAGDIFTGNSSPLLCRRRLWDIPGFLLCNHETIEMFGLVVSERLIKLIQQLLTTWSTDFYVAASMLLLHQFWVKLSNNVTMGLYNLC